MRKSIFTFLLAAALNSSLAIADDFHQDGILISFPATSKQESQWAGEGHTRHYIQLKNAAQPEQTLVDVFMRVDKRENIERDGAEQTALSCLSMLVLEMPDPSKTVREMSQPKALQIGGRTAMSFSMVHAGKYAGGSWQSEMVTRTSYCIAEPDRTILIQVIAPLNAPQDLFAASSKAVENLRLPGK